MANETSTSDAGLLNIRHGESDQPALTSNGFEDQPAMSSNCFEGQSSECSSVYMPSRDAKEEAMDAQNDENQEADQEEIDTSECVQENLDISGTDVDFDNSAISFLSLNVNESEIEILNNSTSDDEEIESEKGEQILIPETKEAGVEPESDIHCAVCNGYFDCPKFLECLHTFCHSCLLKRVKSTHRYIVCPVCKYKSDIPEGGTTNLIDNVIVAGLVSAITEEQQIAECMVCKLHDEVRESAGQCLDCGDMMCKDCCEKHTYSRLTAKHKVVTLEDLKSDKYAGLSKDNKVVYCKQHSEIVAEIFCTICCIPVCRECTMFGHRSHLFKPLNEAVAVKKEAIKERVELLKQESDIKLVDDSEESDILITEFEKNEFKKLKDAKDEIISVIEQKYNQCVRHLQNEYDIKRRKYCKHKRNFILSERKRVDTLLDKITFILREGSDVETAMLETFITSAVERRRKNLSKVRPKLTRKNTFPLVYFHKEHMNTLEGLTFFTTATIMRGQKEIERKAQSVNAAMHVVNAEVRMKIGKNFRAAVNDISAETKPKSLPSLMSADIRVPMGRGSALIREANSRPSMQGNKPSLLGEYPAQNIMHEYMDTFSECSYQPSCRAQNYRNYNKGKEKKTSVMGRPLFRLNLLTSIDIKVIQDQRVPDISDVTFMSYLNFAVADARNLRLKIFNLNGKFVRYIDDPGPMSVTFCAKHLIWSSQFSAIRLYDVQHQKIVRVQRVPQTASHPLASFNNVKYLIGNLEHSKVEACTIDGSHVHVIQPRDRDGKILQDISRIASRSADQLVSVDQQMKKVVVNDFDGNFTGEYSRDNFEPGGLCITENDHIFVTDKRRNKLILLNPWAEYIRDWNTLVDAPSSVASNGMGRVIVAGNGKSVSLYEYAYE